MNKTSLLIELINSNFVLTLLRGRRSNFCRNSFKLEFKYSAHLSLGLLNGRFMLSTDFSKTVDRYKPSWQWHLERFIRNTDILNKVIPNIANSRVEFCLGIVYTQYLLAEIKKTKIYLKYFKKKWLWSDLLIYKIAHNLLIYLLKPVQMLATPHCWSQ